VLFVVAVAMAATLVAAAGPARAPEPQARPAGSDHSVPAAAAAAAAANASAPASGSTAPAGPTTAAAGSTQTSDPDLKTFAYANFDLTSLQGTLDRVTADSQALTSAADSWSLPDLRTAGETLREDADTLSRDTRSAIARMTPLAPNSGALADIRTRALEAYSLVAKQADAALQLADFSISLDISMATTVGDSIAALGTGGQSLMTSFETLGTSLQSWSAANPAAAQQALARYR
jgi:hypothetical protein